jgi:hypothetical protein
MKKSLFIIRHEQNKPQIHNSKIALHFFEDQKYFLQNMKITILTIRIGNIIGTPESGHNDDAHDHEKPIHHKYINLAHNFLGSTDYFYPQKQLRANIQDVQTTSKCRFIQ